VSDAAPLATLELEARTDLVEVARVLDAVERLCLDHGVEGVVVFGMKIAIDEVLVNVIRYAFPGGGEHVVRVRFDIFPTSARLEVSDDGCPFDPFSVAPPDTTGPLEKRSIGGLGVHLVRQFMDEVRYRRVGDRNVVVMTKRRGKPPAKDSET
jgi:anti-sigma regulatory factor (Ser/Thr protein kinase)